MPVLELSEYLAPNERICLDFGGYRMLQALRGSGHSLALQSRVSTAPGLGWLFAMVWELTPKQLEMLPGPPSSPGRSCTICLTQCEKLDFLLCCHQFRIPKLGHHSSLIQAYIPVHKPNLVVKISKGAALHATICHRWAMTTEWFDKWQK